MSVTGAGTPPAAYAAQEKAAAQNTAVQARAAEQNALSAKDTEGESLAEMLRQAREKAEQRRDSLKLKVNPSRYGDAAMTAYSRLSGARTQAQVSAAAGYAQRQIVRFQAAMRSDSENSERIKAAIRQLQKAVGRAGKKKRELRQEDLLRARQKRARMENQRRRAASLRHELNNRRTMRTLREAGYMREAEIDNRLQGQLAATRMELREQARQLSEQLTASTEAAAREYAAQSAPAPEAPVSVDIQA